MVSNLSTDSRWKHTTAAFIWLFALAVSTRVIYPEPVQLFFFTLMLAYSWASSSLRSSVLACLQRFFERSEGKVILLLLLSATITTILASMREDISSGIFLWLNWLQIVLFTTALFGCTAFLALPPDVLRRAFRLIGTLFGISIILLLLITLYKSSPLRRTFPIPFTSHLHTYWDGSYSGIVALFVPLLFATCGKANIGLLRSIRQRLFWRYWMLVIILLFLSSAFISSRRVIGVILLACFTVVSIAIITRYRKKRYLLLFSLATVFACWVLFTYHYRYATTDHSMLVVSDCARCNEMFLPLWLVDAPRQVAWQEMIVIWQEFPWFGIGIHNETTVLTHPHSRFLQILGGLGIIGFGLFLTILCVSSFKSLCVWCKSGSISGLSLLFVHTVYWTGGFFDLSIWSVWHLCIYACAITMSLSLDKLTESK